MEQKAFEEAFADAEKSIRLRLRFAPVGGTRDHPESDGAQAEMYRQVGQDRKAGLLLQENIKILRQTEPPRPIELADCLRQGGSIRSAAASERKAEPSSRRRRPSSAR